MCRCSVRASVNSSCARCFRSSEMPWCHGGGGCDGRGGGAGTAAGGGVDGGGGDRDGGCGDSDPAGGPADADCVPVPVFELDDDPWARAGAAHSAHKVTSAIGSESFAVGRGTCMGRVRVVLLCRSPDVIHRAFTPALWTGEHVAHQRLRPRMSFCEASSSQVRARTRALGAYSLVRSPWRLSSRLPMF